MQWTILTSSYVYAYSFSFAIPISRLIRMTWFDKQLNCTTGTTNDLKKELFLALYLLFKLLWNGTLSHRVLRSET